MMEEKRNDLIQISSPYHGRYCEKDSHGYCATCADEALPATVLQINDSEWTAMVEINGEPAEVDISLIENVIAGQVLLVHGGVAVGSLDEEAGA